MCARAIQLSVAHTDCVKNKKKVRLIDHVKRPDWLVNNRHRGNSSARVEVLVRVARFPPRETAARVIASLFAVMCLRPDNHVIDWIKVRDRGGGGGQNLLMA